MNQSQKNIQAWPRTRMRLDQITLELTLDKMESDQTPPSIASDQLAFDLQQSQPSQPSSHSSQPTRNHPMSLDLSEPHRRPPLPRMEIDPSRLPSLTNHNHQQPKRPQQSKPNHHRQYQTPPRTLPKFVVPKFAPSNDSVNKRLSSEFEKNKFYVNPNEPPITTILQPEEVFEDLGILGTGSGGSVLKMRHKPSGKICAVKQMRRTTNEENDKRIYMELQVVLQCECDNIVKCFGYFIKQAEVWICMELMTTCFDRLLNKRKRKPLPEKFLGAIAVSTLRGLYYLKDKQNTIHRDVKPSNILINDQGQIKLCDFGISGRLDESLATTRSAGCMPYMAPERLDLTINSYDIRSDVWSLGITLYELAMGSSPYTHSNLVFDILDRIINHPAPRLPSDMEFSQEFRDFLTACLTKNYKDRPKYRELMEFEFIKRHIDTVVSLSELDDTT